jgi:hypothetical protein
LEGGIAPFTFCPFTNSCGSYRVDEAFVSALLLALLAFGSFALFDKLGRIL